MRGTRARLAVRKSIESVRHDSANTGLRRTLGPVQLILVGIGGIIGAGVYVMTGTAAANYAGPAVVVSFGGIRIGVVPVLALLFRLTMMGPVILDIGVNAIVGEWVPSAILGSHVVIGIALYWGYGRHHSRAHAEQAALAI